MKQIFFIFCSLLASASSLLIPSIDPQTDDKNDNPTIGIPTDEPTIDQTNVYTDTIKVMSYNIRNGRAHDKSNSWTHRRPATILMLQDQQPDVFGVQEAFDYQVAYLADNLEQYNWYGVGRQNGQSKGEFTAIFYNTKTIQLDDQGTFWLSRHPERPTRGWDAMFKRTATWALMTHLESGKQFFLVNTHLDHVGKKARSNGLALVSKFIKEKNTQHLPVVLMGDFNVTPDAPCLTSLDAHLQSVREQAAVTDTISSFHKWGTKYEVIDYIYQSGFTQMPHFETVTQPYGDRQYISDHYPITAILVF